MRLKVLTWVLFAGFATSGLSAERPTVILYSSPGCSPCKRALASLRRLGIEPKVTWDCPKWVTQVPTIHWQDASGVWRQHAPTHWSSPQWTQLEEEKLRRWLLTDSVEKSTPIGSYLTVAVSADGVDQGE